jgi:hypothetical protein
MKRIAVFGFPSLSFFASFASLQLQINSAFSPEDLPKRAFLRNKPL